MIQIYTFSCLLSDLSFVEVKPLDINRHVGENVTFQCSAWNIWISVKSNVKYFCESPCSEDKHIILRAASGETKHNKRIELTNNGESLFVTFTYLQKSDSKRYYCGVDRFGPDAFIEVKLKVADAESASSPKTTPKTVVVASKLTSAVTNSSSMSSSSSDIINDMSTSYIIHSTTTSTASATQRAGSVPYLIIGVIVIITALIVLMKFMRKMMKKQLKVVSYAETPQEDTREDVVYDNQQSVSQPAVVSTVYVSATNADFEPDSLYANYSYHQDTELAAESGDNCSNVYLNSGSSSGVSSRGPCAESRVTDPQFDMVYSVAELPKEPIEPIGQSDPNQSESNEDDSLYSLAQLTQAT